MTRDELVEAAAALNEAYREGVDDLDLELELGFLVGTAEMVTTLTLEEGESFHDVREEMMHLIDSRAALTTYRLLAERN